MPEWTHFDENGNARMVDVTEKNPTIRTATAVGSLLVSEEVLSPSKATRSKKEMCSQWPRWQELWR